MNIKGYTLGYIGTNCYLAWPENSKEAIIVDPGEYSPVLTQDINENELILKYVILTHGHYDHIGGVEELMKNHPEAKLVASKEEADLLKDPGKNSSRAGLGRDISLVADIEVSDGDTLQIGDTTLKIIATPGHTMGGISILMDNFLFSGDTIFKSSIGRTDLYGGDYQTLIDSIIKKIFILPEDTQILPGHMGTTTVAFEKQYNPYARG